MSEIASRNCFEDQVLKITINVIPRLIKSFLDSSSKYFTLKYSSTVSGKYRDCPPSKRFGGPLLLGSCGLLISNSFCRKIWIKISS